jgi:hypothetical protein
MNSKKISLDKDTNTPYSIDQQQSRDKLKYMLFTPNFSNTGKSIMQYASDNDKANLMELELKLKVGQKNDKSKPFNIKKDNPEIDIFFSSIR